MDALTDETVDKNESVRISQINQLAKISTSGSGDEEDVHNDAGTSEASSRSIGESLHNVERTNNISSAVKRRQAKTSKRTLKIVKRSNKLVTALNLPNILNVNPRSIYNKIDNLKTFIKEKN